MSECPEEYRRYVEQYRASGECSSIMYSTVHFVPIISRQLATICLQESELTALRAKLAEAERVIVEERSRGDAAHKRIENIIEAAEAKLAFLKSKGLTVAMAKDADQPERLVYVIEEGSELCDLATLSKLTDAELRAEAAEAKVAELEEVIRINNICHDLHGKVGPREFATGCANEQRKLFGCAPDADEVTQLQAKLAAVREAGGHLLRTIQEWRSTPYRIVGGNTQAEDALRRAMKE